MIERFKKFLPVFMVIAIAAAAAPAWGQAAPPMVVGRVSYVEKDLLRWVPQENDWAAVVQDVPFAAGDALYSGADGRAELTVPNGTWVRVGGSTQIQFIALEPDVAEADVAGGMARFYARGPNAVVKADSPFGYVVANPGTVFDFYVGENSAEVVPVRGTVSFVHAATNARYDIAAGSPSILADASQVAYGDGGADPDWGAWNTGRDNFWAARMAQRQSMGYLPPALYDDAYVLDENGRWELVRYDGADRWFWRPTVAPGWAPFTAGRWTEWYGDQTWIPAEPFGYVTHHYGNWVFVRGAWYGAPPVVAPIPGRPLLAIGFGWYPGRVSWISGGAYVGWVPLAPHEPYYCRHAWGGPGLTVVTDTAIGRVNISIGALAYANLAVLVPQHNFYNVSSYRGVRVTNVNVTTIINSYHAAPVVTNTVIANYGSIRERYEFTNVVVNEKPHASVVARIERNREAVARGGRPSAAALERQVKTIKEVRPAPAVHVAQPKMTSYIVPASQMNRPRSEVSFQQKEIKGPARGPEGRQAVAPKPGEREVRPGQPPAVTERPPQAAQRPPQPPQATQRPPQPGPTPIRPVQAVQPPARPPQPPPAVQQPARPPQPQPQSQQQKKPPEPKRAPEQKKPEGEHKEQEKPH